MNFVRLDVYIDMYTCGLVGKVTLPFEINMLGVIIKLVKTLELKFSLDLVMCFVTVQSPVMCLA